MSAQFASCFLLLARLLSSQALNVPASKLSADPHPCCTARPARIDRTVTLAEISVLIKCKPWSLVKPGCSRARIVPWLVSSAKLLRIAAAQPACLSPSSGRPRTFEAARGAFRCSHLFIAISLLLPEWNSLRSQHVAHRQPYNAGQDPNAIRTQDDWNFASPPCYLLCLQ